MKQCPICQESLNVGVLVCTNCQSKLKHCPNCGALLLHTAKICPTCKSDLAEEEAAQNYNEKRQKALNSLRVAGAEAQGETVYKSPNAPLEVHIVSPPKPFIWQSILTFFLYYLGFWIIGFIANLIFLGDAKREKERTGRTPSGSGCLDILIFFHVTVPVLLICISLILLILAPEILSDMFNF